MWHNLFAMCGMVSSYVWHDPSIMCDMRTHSDVAQLIRDAWHASFTCVTWLIYMRVTRWLTQMWHNSFLMCGMTHSYVWHDSLIMCDVMTHSYVWHETLITRDTMTHSDVAQLIHDLWHDSSICVTWLIHTCDIMTNPCMVLLIHMAWVIHMCDMTHC